MILNILMTVILYPTYVLVFLMIYKMYLNTDKYLFGVTLPKDMRTGEKAEELISRYKKGCLTVFLCTGWWPVFSFFTSYISIQFAVWLFWFVVAVFSVNIPFIRTNKRALLLKQIPKEQGEGPEYIELISVRTFKAGRFVMPVIISLAPAVYFTVKALLTGETLSKGAFGISAVILASTGICTVLFAVLAFIMDRKKTLVINADSDINVNYSRAVKRIWTGLWLKVSWVNTVLVLLTAAACAADYFEIMPVMAVAVLYTVVCMALIYIAFIDKRKLDSAYEDRLQIHVKSDDDRHWIWGRLYYNKNDKQKLVADRYGMGLTINYATKFGKASIIFSVVCLLLITLFCVQFALSDFVPMRLKVSDNTLVCSHIKEEYRIELSDIKEIQLLDSLPEFTNKREGSETEYYKKGVYGNREDGDFLMFVDLRQDSFIKIVTKDAVYYINDANPEVTVSLFNKIHQ